MINQILSGQLSKQLIQDLDKHCSIALNKRFVSVLNYEVRVLNLNSSKQNKKISLDSSLGSEKIVIGKAAK